MKLTPSDLQILCNNAISAAKKAGKLISEYVHENVAVQHKEAADSLASQVVTEVDVKAQDCILELLEPTIGKYDLALLTEESTDNKSRFEKDYFWCVDPMDGTLAFTEKKPGFAVSIALVSKAGEAMIGVVYDPATKNLYHAIKGQGAYKNNSPWNPLSAQSKRNTFSWYVDSGFTSSPNYPAICDEIKELLPTLGCKDLNIVTFAGAVLNACWVLDRSPGCYFKIPKSVAGGGSLWDFAATACIFSEAGAYACSVDGSALDLNRRGSTFMNHKGVLYASHTRIASCIKSVLEKYS